MRKGYVGIGRREGTLVKCLCWERPKGRKTPVEAGAGGDRTGVWGGGSNRGVGMEGELMRTRVIMEECENR